MGANGGFMRESDAFSWYMEQDPQLRSTVVVVVWLEGVPAWGELGRRLDRATQLAPSFRNLVAQPPARLSNPRWTADPSFDLTWHLRRVEAPLPHTPAAILEMARVAAMTAFDRSRPLWEFTLVEGLESGGAALIMKMHHSLTDGIGGVQLSPLLFDSDPKAPLEELPGAPPAQPLTLPRLIEESVGHDVQRAAEVVWGVVRGLPRTISHAVAHPAGMASNVIGKAGSFVRTVKPVTRTLSPLAKDRGPGRCLHMVTVDFHQMKAAAATVGGTVNDGFMAGVTGGLRRYHERHGASVGELMVTLPISIRMDEDPAGGNRITLQRFTVPVGTTDPAVRIRVNHERCAKARSERSLGFTDSIAGVLNLLPSPVIGSMLKHVDFIASDVPGFPSTVYLCGVRVTGCYAFGPTIGAAMNATLFSYDSKCCIGVNIDTSAIPDHGVLLECLREGFAEVLALCPREGRGGASAEDRIEEVVTC